MESFAVLEEIKHLFNDSKHFDKIEMLLYEHSNLPGPRGNLTLAFKFAECFETERVNRELLNLLIRWTDISADEAPVNDKREFLPFCGIVALGVHYAFADAKMQEEILKCFRKAMNDPRWRMREGAAMGLQKIAEKDFETVRTYFVSMFDRSNFLEKRGFVATLAHPPILENKENVQFALEISDKILEEIPALSKEERKTETFITLSKGLQYALSVFAAQLPEEGFSLLEKYAKFNDAALNKIIKSNLSKSRLTKSYSEEVKKILSDLN